MNKGAPARREHTEPTSPHTDTREWGEIVRERLSRSWPAVVNLASNHRPGLSDDLIIRFQSFSIQHITASIFIVVFLLDKAHYTT